MLIYAIFAQPLNYIPLSFLEGWYHTSTRYNIAISSITLVFLSNASSSINAMWGTCSHPGLAVLARSPSSGPLTWADLVWTDLFILVEGRWQRHYSTSSA